MHPSGDLGPAAVRRPLPAAAVALAALAVAVVAALAACAGSAPRSRVPVVVVHPQPGAARPLHPARARPRLVVLGDSVPVGEACSCVGFARRLAEHLAAAAGRPAELSNFGQDGLTSDGLRQQLDDRELARRLKTATLVTVTVGANDFDPDLASREDCLGQLALPCYQDRLAALGPTLAAILGRIRSLTPRRSTLLVTGYWNVFLDGAVGMAQGSTYVATSGLLTRAVNDVVARESARAGATYVDLYQAFESRTLPDLTALLAPDGDHPSAEGHEVIAAALSSAAGLQP